MLFLIQENEMLEKKLLQPSYEEAAKRFEEDPSTRSQNLLNEVIMPIIKNWIIG